jgi:LPXTG-motif cell wall-anchored protein
MTSMLVYQNSSGNNIVDFFGEVMKELMPGDEKTVLVELKNNYTDAAIFYMRACPVTLEGAAIDELKSEELTAPGASFTDKKTLSGDGILGDDDLLDMIQLTLTSRFTGAADATLYSGTLRGGGTGIYGADPMWTRLGEVNPDDSCYIEVAIEVPVTLPNYYQDSMAAVEWQFYATFDGAGEQDVIFPPDISLPTFLEPPPAGAAVAEPSTPTSPIDMDETPPPLASTSPEDPGTEFGDEEEPPLADYVVELPKTGDDQTLWLWITIASAGAAGFVVIAILGVRRKKETEEDIAPKSTT